MAKAKAKAKTKTTRFKNSESAWRYYVKQLAYEE
jgi:hypothetical protein